MFFETAYNGFNSIGTGNVFGYRDNSTFGLAGLSDRHYGGQFGYRDDSTFGLSDSAYATTGTAVWQTLGYGSKALWKAAGSPGASGPAYGIPGRGLPPTPLNPSPPMVVGAGDDSAGASAGASVQPGVVAAPAGGGIGDMLSGNIFGIPILYLIIGAGIFMMVKK